MEFEYWWLLFIPLFFSLGWIAARIDIKHVLSESRRLPASYFQGLNFLLNEQTDKAIEAFIEIAKADTETVELQFALGSLFRRRGEVERAIRMHQSLLERSDLSEEKKLTAMNELGQDYLKAGLLDRAEQVFSELQKTRSSSAALKFLLEIYVLEKDWLKAVDAARRLGEISSRSYQIEIAHFYCELAASEIAHSDHAAAREHLEEALRVNRDSVRANILLGDIEIAEGRHEAAIQFWKRVETQNPAHLALVAERLLVSHRALDRFAEGMDLLRGYLARYGSLDMLNVIFQAVLETDGPPVAYRLARDELRRNPSMRGLDRLLEAQLLEAPAERRQDLQLVHNLIHQHSAGLALYRCDNCGFRARQYFWHCPACGKWETYPPRRSEESEVLGNKSGLKI
ncbi:MAG TPA: lipopolysaccharide assembly protein LapB [Sulfuricella sp.]|nr:lipopolysaccharide assembly protein LapB [Sulfuricella sp.]